MDSGSGLTIGIKGDLKVIDSVKRLFITIWDKIRYRKQEEFKKSLEALDSSLDVLCRIKEKQDAGTIDAGEAARLKHVIINGAVELLQAGTNLQELQSAEVVDNEALLIQLVTPKYLTEHKSSAATEQQAQSGV
jgi:hypothetical protein